MRRTALKRNAMSVSRCKCPGHFFNNKSAPGFARTLADDYEVLMMITLDPARHPFSSGGISHTPALAHLSTSPKTSLKGHFCRFAFFLAFHVDYSAREPTVKRGDVARIHAVYLRLRVSSGYKSFSPSHPLFIMHSTSLHGFYCEHHVHAQVSHQTMHFLKHVSKLLE